MQPLQQVDSTIIAMIIITDNTIKNRPHFHVCVCVIALVDVGVSSTFDFLLSLNL